MNRRQKTGVGKCLGHGLYWGLLRKGKIGQVDQFGIGWFE